MLDKVESPETTVNQMIREMEQAIIEMRRTTATAIAQQKMTVKRLERTRADARKWSENAELAVNQGNDDLARQALERRRRADRTQADLEQQLATETELVEKMKAELRTVEERIQEVRSKRETLLAKKRAAESRQRLSESAERHQHGLARAVSRPTLPPSRTLTHSRAHIPDSSEMRLSLSALHWVGCEFRLQKAAARRHSACRSPPDVRHSEWWAVVGRPEFRRSTGIEC